MKQKAKKIAFKAGERNVFLHILTACNLSCIHCYINPEQHGTGQVSKETMAEWIALFANKDKKTNIIFLGGEPSLHPDLPYAIKKAKEYDYIVNVNSNGYLFHNLLDKTGPKLIDSLTFSLDGPDAETNDAIRGKGVFDICISHIKLAVARGFNVGIIYTVSKKNFRLIHKMIPLLLALNVRNFFVQVIGLRGNSIKSDDAEIAQVTSGGWLDTVPNAARLAAEAGIHVNYPKVFLLPKENFDCAGNVAENYFIFPNGRVYQCPLCEDYPINAYTIESGQLRKNQGLTEDKFFKLNIKEGCVMNKLLQPDTLEYDAQGVPLFQISCCLLKQESG